MFLYKNTEVLACRRHRLIWLSNYLNVTNMNIEMNYKFSRLFKVESYWIIDKICCNNFYNFCKEILTKIVGQLLYTPY